MDLIAYTPHLPKPGETILGSKYEMGCGGKVRFKVSLYVDWDLNQKKGISSLVLINAHL